MGQLGIERIIVLSVVAVLCIWAAGNFSRILLALAAVMPFPLALTGAQAGGNVCAADCVAAFGFVIVLLRGRVLALGPPAVPLAIFFLTALVSSLASSDLYQTALAIVRMGLASVVALVLYASWDGNPRLFHKCFATYLGSLALLSSLTVYMFVTGGYQASMYTLGISKNALGTIYGCGVAIALGYLATDAVPARHRRLIFASLALTAVSLLLVLSRGGWIATAAAALLILVMTRRYQAFSWGLLILVPLLTFVWFQLPEKATGYATDVSSDTYVIKARFTAMEECMNAFRSSPVIGVGIDLRRRVEPHNVLVLTLGEMGVIGVGAFVAMMAAGGYVFYRAAQVTRHDTKYWPLIVTGSAVFLVTVVHGLMDVYWRRGVSFLGWASVGMAVSFVWVAPAVVGRTTARRPSRHPVGPPVPIRAAVRMNPQPPAVLHLLDTDGFAGTEQHVLQLASELVARGCRSAVACRLGSPLEAETLRRGLSAVPLFVSRSLFGRVRALRRAAAAGPFNVLHGHNGRTMLAAALASRRRGPIAVGTQHFIHPQHTTYRRPKRWLAAAAHWWVNGRLSCIIAVSAAAQDAMTLREGVAADKVVHIPNGIARPFCRKVPAQVRAELGVTAADPLIVTVARLTREKGIPYLLAAMPQLLQRHPRARLAIAGVGPLEPELRAQTNALAISNAVQFLGFRDDAPDLIAAADVFVLPSPAEPFGLVLLEAMALGRPVVAVGAGGPAEIILNGETGLLVPPNDANALADAVSRLLDHPAEARALAMAGLERFQQCYTAEQMAARTLAVYQEALKTERSARAALPCPDSPHPSINT